MLGSRRRLHQWPSHIDHHAGKLGWQHTDEGIGARAGLVACGQGRNVLRANTLRHNDAPILGSHYQQLNVVGRATKFVVVAGGGIERWSGVGDEAQARARSTQLCLENKASLLHLAGGGREAISAHAQRNLVRCVLPLRTIVADDLPTHRQPVTAQL